MTLGARPVRSRPQAAARRHRPPRPAADAPTAPRGRADRPGAAASRPTNGSGSARSSSSSWPRSSSGAAYEQAGSTLNLFADRYTRLDVFGFSFPLVWFQSVQPLFVIMLRAGVRVALDAPRATASRRARPSSRIGLIFVGAGFAILIPAAAMAQSDGRQRQPVVARRDLLRLQSCGELCAQPGRPERDDQARAGAHRRPDDGRLVPRRTRSATFSAGWARRLLRARCRCHSCSASSPPCCSIGAGVDVRARQADQAADGRSPAWQTSGWRSKNTKQKRNFTTTPEPAGDATSPPSARRQERAGRCSSACRSISPATCTTTSGSSTTACCCRGPCRRDRRSIRRPSGSRCTSRIIRSSTATFEGVIPEGYGAGIVMLWDRGTWTPEVDDVDAALKKGDLKFTLDGYKLKGSWVLVRTGGRYRGRARRRRPQLAADQAPRRLGRRPRHRRVRAAQREERRRLRGHPRRRQPGDLELEPARARGRDRRDAREDHRARRWK